MSLIRTRFLPNLFLCLLGFQIYQCSISPVSGGETLNERTIVVYMPDGKTPAANTTVSIGYTGEKDKPFLYSTDKNGHFFIPELRKAYYSIFLEKINSTDSSAFVAFQDSIFISPDSHSVHNDTLSSAVELRGYVRLEEFDNSRENFEKIKIHILGTHKFTYVDSTGAFLFRNIAPGSMYNLEIESNLRGYRTPEYRDVQVPNTISSFEMDTINLKFIGIPPVFIKSLEYDSLRGVTKVIWNKLIQSNLIRYTIYRSRLHGTDLYYSKMPVGFTSDTIWYGTVFASNPKQWQHNLTDPGRYTYRYTIEGWASDSNKSITLEGLSDTVSVHSPIHFQTQFIFQLLDSASNKVVPNGVVSRTAAIIFSVENKFLPFNNLHVRNEKDSLIRQYLWDTTLTSFEDTLFIKSPESGKKFLYLTILDSTMNKRPLSSDTIDYEYLDFNIYVSDFKAFPLYPVAGKPIGGEALAGCFGHITKDTSVDVALYCDTQLIWHDFITLKQFEAGKKLTVFIDTAFSTPITITGPCSLTFVINGSDAVFESFKNDNVFSTQITVTDIDLKVATVVFDSTVLFSDNRYRCGARITNIGTTDYNSAQFFSRISFDIDGNFAAWGFPDTIKAGDTVTIWGEYNSQMNPYWPAMHGEHSVSVIIDPEEKIPELNKKNNTLRQKFTVNNYNVKVSDFSVRFNDSLTRASATARITRSGTIYNLNHSNHTVPEINVYIITDSISDTMTIKLTDPEEVNTLFTFPIDIDVDVLFCNGKHDIEFRISVDPENRLQETSKADNEGTFIIPKTIFYVNGELDDATNDTAETIFGWTQEKKHPSTTLSWDSPGEYHLDSRTISIQSDVLTSACWKFPLIIKRGRHYRASAMVRGDNIKQGPEAIVPAISIGFAGPYGNLRVEKGETFDWTRISGSIYAPDVLNTFALACNLGYTSSDSLLQASGRVCFDDIMLETVSDEYITP